jgi:hypothetical protein
MSHGKRHRAHNGNEAGEWDDLGIYYFKWTGEGFAEQVIDYGAMGTGNGCGIHFALADLQGTGAPRCHRPRQRWAVHLLQRRLLSVAFFNGMMQMNQHITTEVNDDE